MNTVVHAAVIARVQARLEAADGVELQQFLRFSEDELALLATRELGFGMTVALHDPQIPQTDAEQEFYPGHPQEGWTRSTGFSGSSTSASQGSRGPLGAVNHTVVIPEWDVA